MRAPAAELDRTPNRPRLKPWYRIAHRDRGVILRYGGSVLEFGGEVAQRLLPRLLPLLDGTRTVEAIVAELGEPARPAILNALSLLGSHRLLDEAPPETLDPGALRTVELLAASDPYASDTQAVAERLAGARVSVLGSGGAARLLPDLLSPLEVEAAAWDDGVWPVGDLVVVAPAAAELGLLRDWNRVALERGFAWLQVLPFDGQLAAVGPLFVPGQSACYECYRRRRAANVSPLPDDGLGDFPSAPALDAVLAGQAALVALRHLGLGDGGAVGVLLALEQSPAAASRHVVHRVPRCPECSLAAEIAAPSPWSEVHRIAA
ncbi:MAG TPA: TOMM precursor leader peptide-binding protein [Gaiellaceae bacterium]|nr:TOMM precursor leader peptide-binding protein [Gaiellaceae bacterium]